MIKIWMKSGSLASFSYTPRCFSFFKTCSYQPLTQVTSLEEPFLHMCSSTQQGLKISFPSSGYPQGGRVSLVSISETRKVKVRYVPLSESWNTVQEIRDV